MSSTPEYIDDYLKQFTLYRLDNIQLLKPEIVINRITGDPNPDELIEPKWLIKKFGVLNEIDKEMARRDSYQGSRAK